MPFVNGLLKKKGLQQLVQFGYLRLGLESTVKMLDGLKDLGFLYATKSGLSIGIDDLTIPQDDDSTQGLAAAVASGANISREWEFAQQFNGAPGTSTYTAGRSTAGATDEMHVCVIDEDGLISGVTGNIPVSY